MTQQNAIDEYIDQFPESVREKLQAVRQAIRETAPEASEKISYQMPTFFLNGNLVHFAGFNGHIGFYPTPSAIAKFAAELEPYPHAKGSVRFPHDMPLPLDLIKKMVAFRVEEQTAKRKKSS
jgi:uncharacterized protein YdhG (YjbR/CyaY superfamily)